MPEASPQKRWIPGLDLLRCTAVFLVLIGHAKLLLPDASRDLFKQCFPMPAAWGVELFFSLSGFLIGRRWVAMNLSSDGSAWKGVNHFVRNRWFRTMPTYWLLLALLLLTGAISLGPRAGLLALISNLTLTNWITGTAYALPVSWTLAIEEFSYLLIGGSVLFTLPLLRSLEPPLRRQWLPLFPALLILIGVLIRITAVQTGHWQDLSHSPWHRLDALAYGLLLACWVDPKQLIAVSDQCWRQRWLPALLVAGLLILQQWRINLLVSLKLTTPSDGMLFGMLLLPAIGLITSGWVLLAAAWQSSGSKHLDHAIQHLARISYSVYLVHIPLRTFMLRQWTADTAFSGFLLFSSFLALSILLGDLTYRMLEKPFLTIKRRLNNSQQLSSALATPPIAAATTAGEDKH